MSALARYFHLMGKQVQGYDRVASVVSRGLEAEGIKVFYNLDPNHIAHQDMVVYTPAISRDNAEYQAALQAGIPLLKRSEVLGIISRDYQTLAVAGTHGKTTTSAMLTHVLQVCGMDCTAFLGGISKNIQSNFRHGQSQWLVAEADEYDRSFLSLNPWFAIITSMDPDHLDIYGNQEAMKQSFLAFARQSQHLLVHEQLKHIDWGKAVKTYGIDSGDFCARRLEVQGINWQFDFVAEGHIQARISLPMPGQHNVANMLAALSMAWMMGAKAAELQKAAATFAGIYRRFEFQYHDEQLSFIDDYAHHPAELEAAISTARKLFPQRQLVVIFQPHLFSRTRDFAAGFARALSMADVVLLLDIYPARELPMEGVSSQLILDQLRAAVKQLASKEELIPLLDAYIKPPAAILSLGAGDIDREVPRIASWVQAQAGSLGTLANEK